MKSKNFEERPLSGGWNCLGRQAVSIVLKRDTDKSCIEAVETLHSKTSQSTTGPFPISVKVGEPVDFTENVIVAEFEHPMYCGPCGARVRSHLNNAFFGTPPPLETIITFLLDKQQSTHMELV
jgi:hypothetical protein